MSIFRLFSFIVRSHSRKFSWLIIIRNKKLSSQKICCLFVMSHSKKIYICSWSRTGRTNFISSTSSIWLWFQILWSTYQAQSSFFLNTTPPICKPWSYWPTNSSFIWLTWLLIKRWNKLFRGISKLTLLGDLFNRFMKLQLILWQ